MKPYNLFLTVFVGLVFLIGCSKDDVEKETTPPVKLEFPKNLIGLWKSDAQIKSESPRSSDIEVLPFSGYRNYTQILFRTNTAMINEWQEYYQEDKMISETYLSQKCELIEVNMPYYTLLITEGKNMGERMVFKYIPDKKTIEWVVYVSLGFIQNPKNLKKTD
ncbi:hypothetical protein JN06_02715 [Bacteroides zoogleoformans]|uniref:Lipocalin-like protein n=1 Tax=Bacteroides zoogleoformans TaxID=28119 RepID=A0ABN5INE6_9BACE|nr:hypothetical protein [Bacteroides zoogleoformans]AVM53825.1 hypothetical protein C4H11_13730 [Bacteroides zoogleoformans]TWJ08389.1 hypothetical protein JN06_02715 [Bacteroides zoogleoformans]